MNRNVQRSLPIFLSILGSAGVIATAILVGLEAEKANKNIKEAKNNKDTKGVIISFIKGYYPALIIGSATISSIIAGTIISKKIEVSLTATALMLDTSLRRYKEKLKEVFGDRADSIFDSIIKDDYTKLSKEDKETSQGELLYGEEHIGFFKTTPSNLEYALGLTNEKIISKRGWSSLREFLADCNAKIVPNSEIDDVSYDYGWYLDYLNGIYINDSVQSSFLHITKEPVYDENGEFHYYIIRFDKDPVFGVTPENISRLGGYRAANLEIYEDSIRDDFYNRDEDTAALLYNELKGLKKNKKKVTNHVENI